MIFVNSLNIFSLHPSFSFEFKPAIYFFPNSADKKEFIINFINGSKYLFRFSLCCFPEKKTLFEIHPRCGYSNIFLIKHSSINPNYCSDNFYTFLEVEGYQSISINSISHSEKSLFFDFFFNSYVLYNYILVVRLSFFKKSWNSQEILCFSSPNGFVSNLISSASIISLVETKTVSILF